jgi:hypothetical protein
MFDDKIKKIYIKIKNGENERKKRSEKNPPFTVSL